MTEADLKVQKMVEQSLRHHFPGLKVKGEESAQSLEKVDVSMDPTTLDLDIVSSEILEASFSRRAEFLRR